MVIMIIITIKIFAMVQPIVAAPTPEAVTAKGQYQ